MTKGLLLDLDAIASEPRGRIAPFLEEVRALGHEVHLRPFRAACDYVLHVDGPTKNFEGAERLLQAVLERLDLKPKRTELMALAPTFAEIHRPTLADEATRALPALAEAHRIAVLTYLPSFLVLPALEPVKPHLAALVTAREAKAPVPSPKAFRAGVAALRMKAKDVAFVSPHCDDLAIAKPLGLRTVLLRRYGDADCATAAATVPSLGDIEAALAAANPAAETTRPAPQPTG